MDVEPTPEVVENVVGDESAKPVNPNIIQDRELTPGVLFAQVALLFMAVVPIYYGCKAVIATIKKGGEEKGEEIEIIGSKDAMKFPITASCALFGLYLITKAIDPKYLNYLLSTYLMIVGVIAVTSMLCEIEFIKKLFPDVFNCETFKLLFTSKKKDNENNSTDEILNLEFTYVEIALGVMAVFLGAWYLMTKHWIANNIFGLAFSMGAIEMMQLGSFQSGCILLGGLFIYDVFWVFGTTVMVSVAKNIDAPIKILFPIDFLELGIFANKHSMLGLGDIVIPGIMVALLARFDLKIGKSCYFKVGLFAYISGLTITMIVMNIFSHAQPALLYLVPTCTLFPMIAAYINGDFKELWTFSEEEEDKEEKKKDD